MREVWLVASHRMVRVGVDDKVRCKIKRGGYDDEDVHVYICAAIPQGVLTTCIYE